MPCLEYKSLHVPQCPDAFVIGGLDADTDYTFEFTGRFNQRYRGTVSSDADGKITIPVDGTTLRKSLFQNFSGAWTLGLFTTGGGDALVPVMLCDTYTHFQFVFHSIKPMPDPNNIVIIDCAFNDNSGEGTNPGDLAGGRYDADAGTDAVVPDGWVKYQVQFDNVGNDQTKVGVYTDGSMLIDFGDGPKSYPTGKFVVKSLVMDSDGNVVTVWHNNTPGIFNVGIDSGGSAKNVGILAGSVIPTNCRHFTIGNGIEDIDLSLIPVACKIFVFIGAAFNQAKADEIMQWCDDNGLLNGRLDLRTTPAITPDLVLRDSLETKMWQINP